MAGKRRLVGPNGAVFVPNVAEDTIQHMLKTGQWSELEEIPEKTTSKASKSTKKK